jgi:hypothetical protein
LDRAATGTGCPYDIEVSILPHVPTALPQGKESPVSIECGKAFWGRRNVLPLPGIESQVVQPVA